MYTVMDLAGAAEGSRGVVVGRYANSADIVVEFSGGLELHVPPELIVAVDDEADPSEARAPRARALAAGYRMRPPTTPRPA